MQSEEPPEVHIASNNDVKGTGFGKENVEDIDIVQLAAGDMNKVGMLPRKSS